jgi:hypothetical protein
LIVATVFLVGVVADTADHAITLALAEEVETTKSRF